MRLASAAALLALTAQGFVQTIASVPGPRFTQRYVFPNVPPIWTDLSNSDYGVAHQMAKQLGLQARVIWVDGTANLDKVASDEKVAQVVANAKRSGFNMIVFDVKPISGQVLYNSKLAPKIEEWRGRKLPKEYDPLPAMVRLAKAADIRLVISLNAFSEGHNLFHAGPGYDREEEQSVIYDNRPTIRVIGSGRRDFRYVNPKLNAMPLDGQVAMFTDSALIKNPDPSLFAATLDAKGVVIDGFEFGGLGNGIPPVPKGGSILVGKGLGADWMKRSATPGQTLVMDDEVFFEPTGALPSLQYPLMMNPHHPRVKEYNFAIIRELIEDFGVDGIVYDDRLRYAGLSADFSPAARTQFEASIGKKLFWPDDVFRFTYTHKLQRGIRPGPYYDAWMAFRAQTMANYVADASTYVRSLKPSALFGVYAGSWYGDYPQYGTNIAAEGLDTAFWWTTPAYRRTGFAAKLDFLITGCYYPVATIRQAMETGVAIGQTVESGAQLTNRVANDETWAYAGISLDQFKGDPRGLSNAISAAAVASQGVMVFDYSHDFDASADVFAKAFAKPAVAPHEKHGLIERVKKHKAELIRNGYKERTIPLNAGSAGVGF